MRLKDTLGWAIVLLGPALRWPFPSPEWTHIDERAFVLYPLGFWSGDLNPHFFNYPTLTLYIASALYYVYFLLFSAESLEYFVAYRYFVDPTDILLITRTANTLVSAATVAVCMAVGARLYGRTGGYLAGLLLAVMPLHARFAHLAITDVAAGFFTALAILYGVRVVQEARRGDMALAGLCAGLAAASKYPAGLALLPVLMACLLSRRSRSAVWVPVVTAALGFAVASPYVLLDWQGFREAFGGMAQEHLLSDSHASDEPAWWYWLHHNFRYGLGLAGLPVLAVSLFYSAVGRREQWVVLSGVVVFASLLFGASSVFMRYAQLLAPLLAILMACSGAALVHRRGLLVVWLVLLVAEPLYATVQQRALLGGEDTREQARAWLEEHAVQGQRYLQIPKGAGQIQTLKPEQVFVRMDPFIANYGVERLERACLLLAEGPELPELFINWTLKNYRQVKHNGEPNGEFLICFYQHRLAQMSGRDSLAWAEIEGEIDWRADFVGGSTNAVFDAVDWHFVPIGNFAGVKYSGPDIRIGALPWYGREPLPTGNEFFSAYNLLLAGNRAAQEERWDEAGEAYRTLVEMPFLLNELFTVKYLYQMFIGMGQVLSGLGDMEEAEKAWVRAAKTSLKSADPHFHLGLMFAEQGDYEKSVQHYTQAAELAPDDTIILYNLGLGLFQLESYAESISVLERAVALAPDVETLLNLTVAYGRNGQPDQARATFARARELDPEHPQVLAIARTMAQQR